ncbi:30S ribosomal protein THX [Filimonas effusa]|nr:30S ribosomal protein THX [Filimonas effusa]
MQFGDFREIRSPNINFKTSLKILIMGRGDKKSKKGKIFKGSFGKSRPARPAAAKKAEEKKA